MQRTLRDAYQSSSSGPGKSACSSALQRGSGKKKKATVVQPGSGCNPEGCCERIPVPWMPVAGSAVQLSEPVSPHSTLPAMNEVKPQRGSPHPVRPERSCLGLGLGLQDGS